MGVGIKVIPHNSKCADTQDLLCKSSDSFVRHSKESDQLLRNCGRVPPLSRIFAKYDGKDASRCVLKALAVNCAVLPYGGNLAR